MTQAATSSDHEQGLALFVDPSYRVRFRESLENPRRRQKLQNRLAHFARLDSRVAQRVDTSEQGSDILGRNLRERGALAECYLLSEDADLDGREMPLDEALSEISGSELATFISCVPGRLAYFHGEDRENRHILERPL